MDPWGTPCVAISSSEWDMPSHVDCIRSVLKVAFKSLWHFTWRTQPFQLKKECPMTYAIKCLVIRTVAVFSFLFIALKIWPVTSRLRVSVEWYECLRFLLWWQVRLPSWVRKSLNWFEAIFSVTLKSKGSNEIGWLLLGILWSQPWGAAPPLTSSRP